ncbi:DUF2905 domain-containing protein [bacterium]|nr:DUF2905 domain-containing protein [bacterium]MCP5461848.1 DUF2905 domain-containing protein [bacterium]
MLPLGKICIIFGSVVVMIGIVVCLLEKIGWIGNLPGDFFYRKGNVSFYFPFATCVVLSIVASLVIGIISKLR